MRSFSYNSSPGRVVFGFGSINRVAEEIETLGCTRALILSTPFQKQDAETLAKRIGSLSAGVFAEAAMHTPVDVTERAMTVFEAARADCVVALGGGSTIGLGKAIAWRNDTPQLVLSTTYVGSEVTDILGQTEKGEKTTVRDPKIRPEVVIYDPDLTLGLPVAMSVSSALNAMAHAVEGLYARNANPITSLMAVEGIRALKEALPLIVNSPEDLEARSEALYGSWLCGVVLGSVDMSLHHKLCHTLGGAFDLPHAETHAILLPHTAAFNAGVCVDALRSAAKLFGGDLGRGLHNFASAVGAPLALKDLGLEVADLSRAADMAVQQPYWNPREVTRNGILDLLGRAYAGEQPETLDAKGTSMSDSMTTEYFSEAASVDAVNARIADEADERLAQVMRSVVKHLHALVKEVELTHEEWKDAIDFLTRTGQKCDDYRQEFILLSDVLGASMLVDAINNRRPSGATENTVLGPFHVDGAPEYPMGANITKQGGSETCLFEGRVTDLNGKPIEGARIDVWSDNEEGYYDVQQLDVQPLYNNRGVFTTGADGRYWFQGIKPTSYPIPDDGPVGQLLSRLGRHPYRPAHMHFIVSASGYETVTTHTFADGDKYLTSDAVFGVKETLVATFELVHDEGETKWRSKYDFVLTRKRNAQ